MTHPHRGYRAFTLVETMIAGGLLLAIGSMVLLWLLGASDFWWTSSTQSQLRLNTQQTISRVLSDLRNATRATPGTPPSVSIPAAPGNTTITFYLPTDLDGNGSIIDANGAIEWDLANSLQYSFWPPPHAQLRRIQGAQQVVVANDVTNVQFADRSIDGSLASNEVKITLTLTRTTPQQRTVTATSTAIVKLRN